MMDETRLFHGRNVMPFLGGYGLATRATTFFAKSAGFAYSAKDKYGAAEAVRKAIVKNNFDNLPAAAHQGELGKCVYHLTSKPSELLSYDVLT